MPKAILALMNVEGMTRENVASHLQKYRIWLKRLAGYPPGARVSPDMLQQVPPSCSECCCAAIPPLTAFAVTPAWCCCQSGRAATVLTSSVAILAVWLCRWLSSRCSRHYCTRALPLSPLRALPATSPAPASRSAGE